MAPYQIKDFTGQACAHFPPLKRRDLKLSFACSQGGGGADRLKELVSVLRWQIFKVKTRNIVKKLNFNLFTIFLLS